MFNSKSFFSNTGISSNGILHLSAKEAFTALSKGAILVDIREDYHTHMKTFNVDSYIVCPLSVFDENIAYLPKNKPLIIADATGLHSKIAIDKLIQNGFTVVANLAGGIMDWERDGFPVNKNPVAELSGQCPCMLKPMNKIKNTNTIHT